MLPSEVILKQPIRDIFILALSEFQLVNNCHEKILDLHRDTLLRTFVRKVNLKYQEKKKTLEEESWEASWIQS